MADKLRIEIQEYKLIEKGKKVDDELKARIKAILNKVKKKTAEIELPKGIPNLSKSIDRIVGITSPVEEMIRKVNTPLNQAVTLQSIAGTLNTNFTALDYLKDIHSKKDVGLNMFGGIADLSTSMRIATENNLKAYNGFQFVFGNQSNNLKSAIDINKSLLSTINEPANSLKALTSSIAFQNITDQVKSDKTGYDNYIGFSSALASTLSNSAISGTTLNNFFSADSFITREKEPSILDVLSGSSFTLFDDTESFEEEREIIQQIDDDPKLREQADSFFNELNQIINEDTIELVDEEKVESLFTKFVGWISKTFNKDDVIAKKIAKRFMMVFPYIAFLFTLSIAEINAYQNKSEHQKTQEELHETKEELDEVKSELRDLSNKVENDNQNLLDLNQKILDRINSESSVNMVALKDVNLRNRRTTKSKIIDKVSALQKVIVLDSKVKWMEIIYVDVKDQRPKTGWVYIENFK